MLLRLLFSGSLLLTEFQSITEATGEILTASWTNVTVGAAPVLNLVLTTGDDPLLSANTRFEIQLHPHFAVASDAGIDEVVLRDTLDGTCSVTVDSSMNKLTVQRNGDGSVVNSATQIQFNLNGVTNPSYAGQICVGNIEILDNQAQLSRTLQLPTIVIEPGSLWNAQLEFSNLLSGRRASVVVRMTLAHAIPTDGAITIYLPSPLYGSLSGVSLLSDSGLDGDLEIMSKNNAIWIMRGVRSGGASAEMQDVVFELNGVLHPYIEGPFGSSILLQTLDGSKHIIDQTYVDTSKNNLAKARVVFSSTSLQVKEGDAIGAQYTVVLSDPPYRDTTVILSVGDFVSRSQLTLDPLFLVFSTSNWSIPANVSVSAIDDDAYSGNYTQENLVRVSHTIIRGDSGNTFAGGGDVNVHISENDFPAIRLSNRFLAVIEGLRNDSYQISLTSQPSSDVIVFMKPKDSFIEAYPNEVVFTSGTWNTSKVINVVASTAISTVQTTSGILHVIVSGDVNYDGRNDHVFPQNEVQVYYEPLEMESCVIPCRAGWFSMFNASTGDSKCVGCPRGYFCSGSCSLPVACPKGTSSGVEFAHEVTACQACSIGMYAHSEGLSTCLTCPAGAFCSDPNASPQPCPSGFFSSSGETQCHECPAGNFNNESFQSKCSKCPEGYYCPKGSTNPVACTHGTYSVNSGATPCEKCPAGYACSDPTVEPVSCPIGSYSLFDAVLCTICPGGHFCPFTNQAPQICGSGYYSLPGSLSCKACPRGFACDSSTSTKPNECTLGTYNSIEGAVTCRSCPAGHSCVDVSQSPILCQPGSYSSEGDHICHACPAGSYCPDQYSSPFTCAIGTYSLGSATMCTSCGLGVTCSTDVAPVACTAGYYSVNASSPCLLCEAGNFCSSTSLPPKKCNQGTYSYSGAVSCKSCPYGYTCSTAGDLVACALGQTNNADHSECTFCPKGYECSPFKTSAIACTPGSYSLDGEGQCIQCPKGYMCATTTEAPVRCEVGSVAVAGSVECVNCPAGYYCPQPTSDPLSCPLWHYSTNGSSFCIPCPAGMDCTSASSAPITCPSGSYSLHPASACLSCPAGFECVHSGAAPTVCSPGTFSVEGQARCTQCYAGYYCPQSGQVIQLPCSVGTYTEAGATACTTCPAGMYCPVTNQAKKIACAAGTYSLGSQAQCISCPRGYMCPDVDGSQNEICAPGWFSSGGAVQCTTCPAGHACPDPSTSAPRACPNGYYSLSGAIACIACPVGYACPDSTTKLLVPCAKGTFSAGGAISCTPCPAGFACAFPNSSIVELCQPGFYSTAGLGSCIECPRGYYCDTPNELPKNCSVGYFSLRASTSCSACDPGYECPRPDQLPQPCPVGYYSEGAAANCRSCYPGYKCSLASISPTPEEDACPMGGYCNPSTSFFLCPAGTFGNVTAGESIDHACAPCTEGYFCEMGTTPLTRQICPAGFYCPEGTKRASQNPCTAGTYNPSQGQKSSDICQTCPRGSYCPTGSSEPQVCPQGYFCLEGTRAANQYPCPAGMFSGPKTGLTIASQCNECPSGSYCPEASSAPTKCPAGRYNPKIGAADLHECLDCPPGWSCPHVGQSDYVDRCAKGHYCPGKTVLATDHPCPAGTYTESLELTRSQDCTICPSRHSCLQGTGGETQAMLECGPGFFCPNGTAYPNQFPCQPGTWSPSTSLSAAKECNICPTGKYCQGGKSYIDGNCAPGHFCPLGTYSSTQFQCPSGTYTAKTCLFEPSQCDDCPPGHYCPTGSAAPIPCKAGSYASLNNTKSVGPAEAWPACITCPAGYYCIEASSVPHHCGKGNFSTSGSKTCSTCEAGFFCSSETTSAANMRTNTGGWSALGASYGTCYNGTYCPVGLDREPALELDACPPGFYCPTATPLPIICPAGTYSNFTGQDSVNDCTPTPAGYFSIAGSLEPTGVCSPGFYCPIRSTSRTQVPCPARYYLDRTKGQSEEDCALCFSGSYCPPGTAYPIKCPRGYYCRTGIAYPEPCPIGTYANASGLREEDDCQFCLPGMYCDSTALTSPRGLCDPGYYCFVGAHTSAPTNHELNISGVTYLNSGGRCPRGAYCPLGSSSPTLCPPGTFNNFTGLESANQCLQCPPGKYCETPGLLAPTGSCYPGYFCIGGAVVPTQMETPAGSLSLVGATAPTPCPPGLYNLHPAQNQCEVCPAGFYCESPGTILPKLCPIGNYCPEGTTLPVKCLPGTFATGQGLVMIEQCTPCPVGQYCDSYGLSAPSGSCFAGFVCSGASPIANPIGRNYGYVCPVGNYCPEGTKSAIPCPLGSFRTESGGTSPESCSLCPGGKHCSSTALAAPSGFCSAGYYCVYNASTPTPIDTISGAICPTGFHCPEASTAPIKCSAGTYAAKKGQDVCDKCPAGHFCDGVTTSTYANCPAGHYCPAGTAQRPFPCPVGTFSNLIRLANVTECQTCTAGFFCEKPGQVQPSGLCAAGNFCPPRSENAFGRTADDDTHVCPAGFFCPEGTYLPLMCPTGTYSNATGLKRFDDCVFCDEGAYCTGSGLVEPTGPCDGGYYCRRNNTQPDPSSGVTMVVTGTEESEIVVYFGGQVCPIGSYCPRGSVSPLLCPEGSYADVAGISTCLACPSGFFCPRGCSDYLSNECPIGHYCPESTKRATQFPCPPGSFGNRTRLQSPVQCTLAPGGTFVDGYAAMEPTGSCRSGFYCSGGSATSTPADITATGGPCLLGTNCPEGSAIPIVCNAGAYCSSTNIDAALPCKEGFYCVQGSYTATPTGQTNSLGRIGDVCTRGHYCPQGTSNPIPCIPGTYSETTQNVNASNCLPCSPGYICSTSGIVTPFEKCPAGFFCTGGDSVATQRCPKGFECPESSIKPRACPAGTFADEIGLSTCKVCPERFYCEAGSVIPLVCPQGHYCPSQTPSPTKYPCPAGSFGNFSSLASPTECTQCPPGRFCTGLPPTNTTSGECAPGFYCAGNATTAKPLDGIMGGICRGGHICYGGSAVPDPIDGITGQICNPGFYCPEGSPYQIRCPKGTYNSIEKQSFCVACPAGSYCDTNSSSPVGCPLRYYCPRGTINPVLCPNGTYGHEVGLTNAEECAPCPAGKFCLAGTVTASCTAGYYCRLRNDHPNPNAAKSDNISNSEFTWRTEAGGPCPIGHYCPEGVLDPIPCPTNSSRIQTLGAALSDCGLCPAGKSCTDGIKTIPCPTGSYCPYSVGEVPCPPGTFNGAQGKENLEDCRPCDAGKLCNRTGIIDLGGYDCPSGHFCHRGSTEPSPCPDGTYRAFAGGKSPEDCLLCIEGSFCRAGAAQPIVCDATSYCPAGSGSPVSCPGGSYCPYNSTAPFTCPEGYFCSPGVALPSICTLGHYCPRATQAQIPCPLGFRGRATPLDGAYISLYTSCEACSPGTFGSDFNRTRCDQCLEGFVCLGATTTSHPTSPEADRGYPCPPGFYCPAGSSLEIACPRGTYQPSYEGKNASACLLCPDNTYQNLEGQTTCLPCSSSAYAGTGSAKCSCAGSHRAFQMTDGYCICEPGYEFYDQNMILRSDEDGEVDCQPIVYARCSSSQVRSDNGSCVSASGKVCDAACNSGAGTFVASLGICQCNDQLDLDTVCDKKCRDEATRIVVNSSTCQLQLLDSISGKVGLFKDVDNTSGLFSKVSCLSGSNCQLHSITVASTGFIGSYELPASILDDSARRQRRLTTATASKSIANPMVCLSLGDGLYFDLSVPRSYPIYLKNSMLNTNPSFDHGAFRLIAEKVINSSLVSAFAFSFTEPGTYVFGNSLNPAAQTVVFVMKQGTSCPTEAPIVPLNERNLIALSAKRRTDHIILSPDWGLIMGLLSAFFASVVAIIGALYYFRARSWTNTYIPSASGYRAKTKHVNLACMHTKGTVLVNSTSILQHGSTAPIISDLSPTSKEQSTLDGQGSRKKSKLEHQVDSDGRSEDDMELRNLFDCLRLYHEAATKNSEIQKGDVKELVRHLQAEAIELKRLLVSTLVASDAVATLSVSDASAKDDVAETSEALPISSLSGLPRSRMVADKERILLEMVECSLQDRKHFIQKRNTMLAEVSTGLYVIEGWGTLLAELSNAIVQEMFSSIGDHTPEQTRTNENSRIEHVRAALDNLKTLLAPDPLTQTSSSLLYLIEHEKGRREVGKFILEAYQRYFLQRLALKKEADDPIGPPTFIQRILKLHDEVEKSQNKEDEAFTGLLSSLRKLGAVLPQVLVSIDDLETNFCCEFDAIREERNPDREREVQAQTRNRLNKLLKEVAAGAKKLTDSLEKEAPRTLKLQRQAQHAEGALVRAVSSVKDQSNIIDQDQRDRMLENLSTHEEANVRPLTSATDLIASKPQDDQLSRLKDLLVEPTTCLRTGKKAVPLIAAIPQLPTNVRLLHTPISVHPQIVLEREPETTVQESAAAYASSLELSYPQLTKLDKERLLDDFTLDLCTIQSSISVEETRMQAELASRQVVSKTLVEAKRTHIQRCEQEDTDTLRKQHIEEEQNLKSLFQQEEFAIEQEYLNELSVLKLKFESDIPDGDSRNFHLDLDNDTYKVDRSFPQGSATMADLSGSENESSVDDNADIIAQLNVVYSQAWKDRVHVIDMEEALRKERHTARVYREKDVQLGIIKEVMEDESKNQDLAFEFLQIKEKVLEEIVAEQDHMDLRQENAVNRAVKCLQQQIAACAAGDESHKTNNLPQSNVTIKRLVTAARRAAQADKVVAETVIEQANRKLQKLQYKYDNKISTIRSEIESTYLRFDTKMRDATRAKTSIDPNKKHIGSDEVYSEVIEDDLHEELHAKVEENVDYSIIKLRYKHFKIQRQVETEKIEGVVNLAVADAQLAYLDGVFGDNQVILMTPITTRFTIKPTKVGKCLAALAYRISTQIEHHFQNAFSNLHADFVVTCTKRRQDLDDDHAIRNSKLVEKFNHRHHELGDKNLPPKLIQLHEVETTRRDATYVKATTILDDHERQEGQKLAKLLASSLYESGKSIKGSIRQYRQRYEIATALLESGDKEGATRLSNAIVDALDALEFEALQRTQNAAQARKEIERETMRARKENVTAMADLEVACKVEKCHQEQSLKERMTRLPEKQLAAISDLEEMAKIETDSIKQDCLETQQLKDQVDTQTTLALHVKLGKQHELEDRLAQPLHDATIAILTAVASREAVALARHEFFNAEKKGKDGMASLMRLWGARSPSKLWWNELIRMTAQKKTAQTVSDNTKYPGVGNENVVADVMAAKIEEQIKSLSSKLCRAGYQQQRKLQLEEVHRKAELEIYLSLRHKDASRQQNIKDIDEDETKIRQQLVITAIEQKFASEAETEMDLHLLEAAILSAGEKSMTDIKSLLDSCHLNLSSELTALRYDHHARQQILDDENHQQSQMLRPDKASELARARESCGSGALTAIDDASDQNETKAPRDISGTEVEQLDTLYEQLLGNINAAFTAAGHSAEKRCDDANARLALSLEELHIIKTEYDNEKRMLCEALGAEQNRRRGILQEKMAKQWCERLAELKKQHNNSSEEIVQLKMRELSDEHERDRSQLEDVISKQTIQALMEFDDKSHANEIVLRAETRRLRAESEAAQIACEALNLAYCAEADRFSREFYAFFSNVNLKSLKTQHRRRRIEERLAIKQFSKNHISVNSSYLPPKTHGPFLSSLPATVQSLMIDYIESEVHRLQKEHHRAWEELRCRLHDEIRLRKAHLVERLQRKRQSLFDNTALTPHDKLCIEAAMDREEDQACQNYDAFVTLMARSLNLANLQSKENVVNTLVDTFLSNGDKLDAAWRVIRTQDDGAHDKLQKSLQVKRDQEQILKKRLDQRCTFKSAGKDQDEKEELKCELEEQLSLNEVQDWAALEVCEYLKIEVVLSPLKAAAEQRLKLAEVAEWKVRDELTCLTKVHAQSLIKLRQSIQSNKPRQQLVCFKRDRLPTDYNQMFDDEAQRDKQPAKAMLQELYGVDLADTGVGSIEHRWEQETELLARFCALSVSKAAEKMALILCESARLEANCVRVAHETFVAPTFQNSASKVASSREYLVARLAERKNKRCHDKEPQWGREMPKNTCAIELTNMVQSTSDLHNDRAVNREIARLQEAHARGVLARQDQLKADTTVQKAALTARLDHKRRAARNSRESGVQNEKSLPLEEEQELVIFDKEQAERTRVLEAEAISEMERFKKALHEADDCGARYVEQKLIACRKSYDVELAKLEESLRAERLQQESALKQRLALKQLRHVTTGSDAEAEDINENELALDENIQVDPEVQMRRTRQNFIERQHHEMAEVTRELELEMDLRWRAALDLQSAAEHEIRRLEEEHASDRRALQKTQFADQQKREAQLIDKLAKKSTRVSKESNRKKVQLNDVEEKVAMAALREEIKHEQLIAWTRERVRQETTMTLATAKLSEASKASVQAAAALRQAQIEVTRTAAELEKIIGECRQHEAPGAVGSKRKLADRLAEKKSKQYLERRQVINKNKSGTQASKDEIERLRLEAQIEIQLTSCRKAHDAEVVKLREALQAERERQECALHERIARRKEKRCLLSAQAIVKCDLKAAEEAEWKQDREEEAALVATLALQEQEAWNQIQSKHEEDVRKLQELKLEQERERSDRQQQVVQQEINRLQKEHERELQAFTKSLVQEQARQEEKLQQRIAHRRAQKHRQDELATANDAEFLQSSIGADEEARVAAECERNEAMLQTHSQVDMESEERERELIAARLAQQLEKEQARQKREKEELVARLNEKADEEAAKRAQNLALEMQKLATEMADKLAFEYSTNLRELRETHSADGAAQKARLESRIAIKKARKLRELEEKRELERQRLHSRQQQEADEAFKAIKERESALTEAAGHTMVRSVNEMEGKEQFSAAESAALSSEKKAFAMIRAARQRKCDVTAVQQLFTYGLIPAKLSLLDAVEMVVGPRHERELATQLAELAARSLESVRQVLHAVSHQKAARKAQTLQEISGRQGSSVETLSKWDVDTILAQLDSEFADELREAESLATRNNEKVKTELKNRIQKQQIGEVANLLAYFDEQHTAALTHMAAIAAPAPSLQQNQQPVKSQTADEAEYLSTELRVRLEFEASERRRELEEERRQEIDRLSKMQQAQLAEVDKQTAASINEEHAAMMQMLTMRLKTPPARTARQQMVVEHEHANQIQRLTLMLEGRGKQQKARVRTRFGLQMALVDDEFRRKAQIVVTVMNQQVVQEEAKLRQKRSLKTKELSDQVHQQKNADSLHSSLTGELVKRLGNALEERLIKIEDLVAASVDAHNIMSKDKTGPKEGDSEKEDGSSVAYRVAIAEAVATGCRYEKRQLVNTQTLLAASAFGVRNANALDASTLTLVPADQLDDRMRARQSFADMLLRFVATAEEPAATSAVIWHFESGNTGAMVYASFFLRKEGFHSTNTLYLSLSALTELSTGQLSIVILHALTQARTNSSDLTEPQFISSLYSLIVRCYQGLFMHVTEQHAACLSAPPSTSATQFRKRSGADEMIDNSDYSDRWHDRLAELEVFLSHMNASTAKSRAQQSESSSLRLNLKQNDEYFGDV